MAYIDTADSQDHRAVHLHFRIEYFSGSLLGVSVVYDALMVVTLGKVDYGTY